MAFRAWPGQLMQRLQQQRRATHLSTSLYSKTTVPRSPLPTPLCGMPLYRTKLYRLSVAEASTTALRSPRLRTPKHAHTCTTIYPSE
eukprot:37467-Chlamydomonas_euryale.AAC.2